MEKKEKIKIDKDERITQARRILKELEKNIPVSYIQAKEFLRMYGGKDNSFYLELKKIDIYSDYKVLKLRTLFALESFISYVENGLLRFMSLEREINIETVTEYLRQADNLLNDTKVHPTAPTVIVGASLEEFLRSWLEEEGKDITKIQMNIDSYAKELRKMDSITKQELKDITSWGGLRNDAAHGHWENVNDRKKIELMLAGVNLFINKYQSKNVT